MLLLQAFPAADCAYYQMFEAMAQVTNLPFHVCKRRVGVLIGTN